MLPIKLEELYLFQFGEIKKISFCTFQAGGILPFRVWGATFFATFNLGIVTLQSGGAITLLTYFKLGIITLRA